MKRLLPAAAVLAAIIAVPLALASSKHEIHCGAQRACIERVARHDCLTNHDPWHCRIMRREDDRINTVAHAALVARFHTLAPAPVLSAWSVAIASEYGTTDGLMGATTASGEPVTPTSMDVANLSLALGTKLEMCVSACAVVVVDDRGPYVSGRLFDLQPAVAEAIGFTAGVGPIRWRLVG